MILLWIIAASRSPIIPFEMSVAPLSAASIPRLQKRQPLNTAFSSERLLSSAHVLLALLLRRRAGLFRRVAGLYRDIDVSIDHISNLNIVRYQRLGQIA